MDRIDAMKVFVSVVDEAASPVRADACAGRPPPSAARSPFSRTMSGPNYFTAPRDRSS
jgi:hypothetical protein